MIELKNICKSFGNKNNRITVLDDLSICIDKGEMIAVMGKSGSGKTTLLNILAGIDFPDSGEYVFDGEIVKLNNAASGIRFRRNRIGVIVQHFALINDLTVSENIEVGLYESDYTSGQKRKAIKDTLKDLGIENLKDKYPSKLSGGEKQRVAIGRAIVGRPKLLLCDEPTGALDSETEKEILKIFKRLNQMGATIVIVTHDKDVADICNRTIVLEKH